MLLEYGVNHMARNGASENIKDQDAHGLKIKPDAKNLINIEQLWIWKKIESILPPYVIEVDEDHTPVCNRG